MSGNFAQPHSPSPHASGPNRGPSAMSSLELEIVASDFDLWAAVIRSDQMRQQDVHKLLQANPNFADWYRQTYIASGAVQAVSFVGPAVGIQGNDFSR